MPSDPRTIPDAYIQGPGSDPTVWLVTDADSGSGNGDRWRTLENIHGETSQTGGRGLSIHRQTTVTTTTIVLDYRLIREAPNVDYLDEQMRQHLADVDVSRQMSAVDMT
jgi:hypothetical protein